MQEEEASLPDHLRCKRTDGRQWRCNRRVMDDKKLCEVHYIQGRHRQYRRKVPESLKLQRKDKKVLKVQQSPEIRARKCRRLKKRKKRVIGESEAVDEAVKKMKLKRGDLQLELIRMVLKREVEKGKGCDFEDEDEDENDCSDSDGDSDTETEFTRELPNGLMAVSSICSGANSDNAGASCAVKIGAEPAVVTRRRFRSKNIEPTPIGAVQVESYKKDTVRLRRWKRCHWCRKRGRNLILCSSCQKLFFCADCVKERYEVLSFV